MGGVTLVLKHKGDMLDCIAFEMPEKQFQDKVKNILEKCDNKNGYVTVTVDCPHKPRTTGEKSQNNLIWKLITIIANETGSEIGEVEQGLKDRAINKGYPYHINRVSGKPQGNSMTTIDTVECSYLIDTAYEVIAELGIVLEPQLCKGQNNFESPIEVKHEETKTNIVDDALSDDETTDLDIF